MNLPFLLPILEKAVTQILLAKARKKRVKVTTITIFYQMSQKAG